MFLRMLLTKHSSVSNPNSLNPTEILNATSITLHFLRTCDCLHIMLIRRKSILYNYFVHQPGQQKVKNKLLLE